MALLGHGEVDDIADPEALRLDRRRQGAVEAGELEVLLAAENGERLAPGQDVDHPAVADDVQVVDGHGLGVGRPHERDIAGGGERLGGPHLNRALGIELVLILAEAGLGVLEQELGGHVGVRRSLGNGQRDHPGRRGAVLELVGRAGRACGQHAGGAKQDPGYHAHPPRGDDSGAGLAVATPGCGGASPQFEGRLT